jgi:hypothetical protein
MVNAKDPPNLYFSHEISKSIILDVYLPGRKYEC